MAATTPGELGFREAGRSFKDFILQELKPKGRILTPFNVITVGIMAVGVFLLYQRFVYGLGAVTNLSQDVPWGLWVGFDVVTGVAFAGGAYVLTFMVYVLRIEKYHSIVRITVLNGLLAYVFYAGALLLDLGRPWNVINPIIGNGFGVSSVLFLVAWHFLLYMTAEFLEFAPAVAEWLGLKRVRKVLGLLTLGSVIFGISLSTLHQSGLGALFLMAKPKIHPLWFSEFIPVLFLVSSVFAGLSMVIIEGSLSNKAFAHKLSPAHAKEHHSIVFGLARICAGTMFVYFFMHALDFVHNDRWSYLATGWGAWFGVEMIGFVAFPAALYVYGLKNKRMGLIKWAAGLSLIGIILNRLNISVITYGWYEAVRYVPSWQEFWITATVISAEIWVIRWVVLRMPVLSPPPKWAQTEEYKH